MIREEDVRYGDVFTTAIGLPKGARMFVGFVDEKPHSNDGRSWYGVPLAPFEWGDSEGIQILRGFGARWVDRFRVPPVDKPLWKRA